MKRSLLHLVNIYINSKFHPMPFYLLFSMLVIMSACTVQNATFKNDNPAVNSSSVISPGKVVTKMAPSIMVIYQDAKNTYWFGSMDQGVYQWDGSKLMVYTTEDGLASNRVRSIREDKFGNIYFDSGEGISQFDGDAFNILKVSGNNTNQWRLNPDDLWFEGNWNENGPYRFDGKNLFHLELSDNKLEDVFHAKFPNASFSPYDVYSIYKDREGNLWFGTSTLGVCRYNGQSFDWICEEELTELHDGPALGIRSIIQDKDGNFWFSKPFHRYSIDKNKSTNQGEIEYEMLAGLDQSQAGFDGFMSVVKDINENLWMATYDQGVWKYDGENVTHYSIREGDKMITLYSIYRDRQNNLWLGSHSSGAYRLNGEKFEKFNP